MVHYFGGADIASEMRSVRPIIQRGLGPGLLPPGYLALSRHVYRASFDPSVSNVDYDTYLEASKARYITSIGGSIDIYRVER